MNIAHWQPRREAEWKLLPDGARQARIYTPQGLVFVFAAPGDERHRAFTSLEMYIHPYAFQASLPRRYHDRWLRRLAYDFAWQCQNQLKSQS